MTNYKSIIEHYESCFEKYGDTPAGVDWTREEQVNIRYQVMYELFKESLFENKQISVLDFGCGLSHFYEYLNKNNLLKNINYYGLDISKKFIHASMQKYPHNIYFNVDILKNKDFKEKFDFVILNGVFTEKRDLSYEEMFSYFEKLIEQVFTNLVSKGVAFNIMTTHVDWKRDDLFHLNFDKVAKILTKLSKNRYIIRADYGLFEYTVYLYKD